MLPTLPSVWVLLVLAAGLGACGGIYTVPSRGIAADMDASRGAGSAALLHNDLLDRSGSDVAR